MHRAKRYEAACKTMLAWVKTRAEHVESATFIVDSCDDAWQALHLMTRLISLYLTVCGPGSPYVSLPAPANLQTLHLEFQQGADLCTTSEWLRQLTRLQVLVIKVSKQGG